ncbi:hypothetical protein [Corynebacterium kalidii]
MADARVGIRVQGAARLRRTLRKAGVDIKQLRAVNRDAAQIVATAAAAAAPVGGPYRSRGRGRPRKPGRLKASIRATATNRAGVVKGGYGGTRLRYAGVIHYGWPARNIRAQPFAADAAIRTEPVWTKEYERKVHEVINSVKGK